MALVAGVNIPDNLRVEISLQRIFGIGPTAARQITQKAQLVDNPRVKELADTDLNRIREIIDQEHKVEGDLRRDINGNIRRLMEIGSYRVQSSCSPAAGRTREVALRDSPNWRSRHCCR